MKCDVGWRGEVVRCISSTEYVRLKKQKEAFHFKCNPCSNVEEFVHLGIGNGRDIDQPVASSSSVAADVDQPVASSSRGRGRPRAVVVADVSDQPVASSSRGHGRGRGRNVETPPDSMPTIDQPASYSSRGPGSHTVPPVTTIASLTVNIVLLVSASSLMEDLPLELPIAMNFTCPQDLISPVVAGITSYQGNIVLPNISSESSGLFNQAGGLQLADWSSRYDIPIPATETTVQLRRAHVLPVLPQETEESSDSENENEDETTRLPNWHTYNCGKRNALTLFDGLGYSYGIKKSSSKTTTWRCNNRAKPKECGALAKGKEERFTSARRVVQPILQKNFDDAPEKELPKIKYVIRAVQRRRGLHIPSNPPDFRFDWETYTEFIEPGFYRGDVVVETECTYARHLIFATDRQLELLRNAKRWYGDATFGITPSPWYQVYAIHAFIRHGNLDTQVPLVFVLMTRKRACDYRIVFTHILDLIMVPAVEEFVMDFEAAAHLIELIIVLRHAAVNL
ncbi:hypothetical protein DAPPUDRAFT_115006 [Daphnia pulex]|uniref:FLYWCH-type domain-containing protein n=1 Tax=Daphnia pulex TaxID=6669 RepID=E9HJX0_DAPPU|nr:hypothetical protein DAPPUDRAFT_115006 [Daphnia pulex]|eukprot:EFX67968.1 hypothetical protein DAPPUDRAFT_115006 [Daphnia pulex]